MARPSKLETAVRDATIYRLREAGLPWDMILERVRRELTEEAALTGSKPRSYTLKSCHDAYKRHLARMPKEERDQLRELRAGQLDYLWSRAMQLLSRTYYAHSTTTGALVQGPDGQPLEDVTPKLAALRELRYLNESMRKLRGLDPPSQRAVEVVSEEAVALEIERKQAELASLEARLGAEETLDHSTG